MINEQIGIYQYVSLFIIIYSTASQCKQFLARDAPFNPVEKIFAHICFGPLPTAGMPFDYPCDYHITLDEVALAFFCSGALDLAARRKKKSAVVS